VRPPHLPFVAREHRRRVRADPNRVDADVLSL